MVFILFLVHTIGFYKNYGVDEVIIFEYVRSVLQKRSGFEEDSVKLDLYTHAHCTSTSFLK